MHRCFGICLLDFGPRWTFSALGHVDCRPLFLRCGFGIDSFVGVGAWCFVDAWGRLGSSLSLCWFALTLNLGDFDFVVNFRWSNGVGLEAMLWLDR